MGAYSRIREAGTKTATAVADATEKANTKSSKAADKAAADQEKSDNRVFKNRAKLLAQIAKDDERNTKDVEKNRIREEKAAERVGKAQERAYKKAEDSVLRLEGKIIGLQVKQERMSTGVMRNTAHMVHGFGEMAEGLAIVGITTEENTQKFIKLFAAIHGVSQVFRGALSIMMSLVHQTSMLERATHAAAMEEKTLGQLQAARAVLAGTPAVAGAVGNVAGSAAGRFAGNAASSAAGVGAAAGTGWACGRLSDLTSRRNRHIGDRIGRQGHRWNRCITQWRFVGSRCCWRRDCRCRF